MLESVRFLICRVGITAPLLIFSSFLLTAWPSSGYAADAADAPPATRPAIGAIDLGDYCTVLLAPKLQDKLALTDDQRWAMADLKTDLHAYLDNAIGNMRGTPTAGLIAARSHTALAMIGKKVRLGLTPEQDKALVDLFNDGTLKTIGVVSSLTNEGPRHGAGGYVVGAVQLNYTHYGEKDAAAPTSPETATPTRSASDVPAGASKTEMIGGDGGGPFVKVDPAGRPVLGFSFKIADWGGRKCIGHADALYAQPAEMDPDDARICFAKAGYVVGGIIVNKKDGADGIQVIFMKRSGNGVDVNDSYTSRWYGYTDAGTRTQLGGDGKLVIGTFGRQGMNLDAFGLVVQGTNAGNAAEPAPKPSVKSGDSSDLPDGASKTEMIGGDGGSPYVKVDPAGRPVLGFSLKIGEWAGRKCIGHADPLYDQPADMDPDDAKICFAKDGYVVGGIIVNKQDGADGIQVIFMKKSGTGVDVNDSYTSRWYGYTDTGTRTELGGDGKLVIGTFGRQGMNLDALGLVVQSTNVGNTPESAPKSPAKSSGLRT